MADVVDWLEENRKYGNVNAKNAITMLATLQAAYRGDYTDELENGAEAVRSSLASAVSPQLAAGLLRPLLKTMCKSVIGRGDLTSDASMLFEWYKYFVDNGQRVQGRAITFGVPWVPATNVGNNQFVRLCRDQYNFPIDAVYLDAKRLLCVADYQTGTNRGNEVFQVLGQSPARDDLERSGSGLNTTITGRTADDSFLNNASFGFFSGTAAAPTAVTNWTLTSLTGAAITVSSTYCTFDSTNYFRASPSEGTSPYAIKLASSVRLTQALSAARITKVRADRPYLLAIIWNASVNTAQGTLTIRMGNTNRTVTVTGASGWQVTLVPITSGSLAQQSCWPRLFETDNMSISIDWTQTSAGLLIDDVLLVEGTAVDNTWGWVIPASTTAWVPNKINDIYNFADISASDSKIQKWLWRAFGAYLPSSLGSSITLADP